MSYRASGSALKSRDGDQAYVEDSRKVTDCVQRVQQCVADIQRETHRLAASGSVTGGAGGGARVGIKDAAETARAAALEARSLLEGISTSGCSSGEQHMRRLCKEKHTKDLLQATHALEAAVRSYESAERESKRRAAIAPATASPNGSDGGTFGHAGGACGAALHVPPAASPLGVELQGMDVAPGLVTGPPASIATEQARASVHVHEDVTDAEVQLHAAIVGETASQIARTAQDVRGLQQAMLSLAEHARQQGEVLDNIEANMLSAADNAGDAREQLILTSQRQRKNGRCIAAILVVAFIVAIIVIVIVVKKSGG